MFIIKYFFRKIIILNNLNFANHNHFTSPYLNRKTKQIKLKVKNTKGIVEFENRLNKIKANSSKSHIYTNF